MELTLRSIIILLYSLAFTLAIPFVRLLARLSPKLGRQLADRDGPASKRDELAKLARDRASKRHCVVFFCSSAGELEQARPLIDRLERQGNVYVQVIFLSKAGFAYAKARNETVPYMLSPAIDSVWSWGTLFSALRPDITAIVRHELWPAFIEVARSYGKLYLIDACRSPGETAAGLKRVTREFLLHGFDHIAAVSDKDAGFFREAYSLPEAGVSVTGDTKYDRVMERAHARAADAERLRAFFDAHAPAENSRRLVLGSAYRQEVELMLAAREMIGAGAGRWQIIVVPHHIDAAMIDWTVERCRAAGVSAGLYSQISKAQNTADSSRLSIIIFDTMGKLSEAYGSADAAFVGGGLHAKVHNVLEPASHGLALALGPFYKNSQEAIRLVDGQLASVLAEPSALAAWWRDLDGENDAARLQRRQRTLGAVTALTGASDRIMTDWQRLLGR